MSLAVPADLLDRAQRGEVGDAAFLDCVRTSLPYAWDLVAGETDSGAAAVEPPLSPEEIASIFMLLVVAGLDG